MARPPIFRVFPALGAVVGALLPLFVPAASGQDSSRSLAAAMDDREWESLEKSIDRGLRWLATRQGSDGSFQGHDTGQPAITSLAIMAFLSRGHQPGHGPYGELLENGIDHVLGTQRSDGLFTYLDAPPPYEKRTPSHTATYNHAIAGLMLGEVYGMCQGPRSERIRRAIDEALRFTWRLQSQPKDRDFDRGGWRYIHDRDESDSDISVTGWHLMFLRSAKNAEFDIPKESIDAALGFVRRCYIDSDRGVFTYWPGDPGDANRTMTGIGALSLALGGSHDDPMVRRAGDWMLEAGAGSYGSAGRWHYQAYYMTQAMAQIGGEHWRRFFPVVLRELLRSQRDDGSWAPNNAQDSYLGQSYYTSLAILTLTPPYQLLPLYQR